MKSNCHCCREDKVRAVKNGAGWVVPGVMLLLMPKCPLCLAAWSSLLFGIGLSASVATALHTALIVLCLAAIFLFIIRQLLLFFRQTST